MTELDVVPSGELSDLELQRLRRLLDDAFDHEFSDDDWDHALGGRHAIVTVEGVPIAHAAVVRRQLEVGTRGLTAGYVEAVATAPAARGLGHGSRALRAVMDVVRREFEIGALSTDRHGFYERSGWERWHGPSFVIDEERRTRTADEDDGIMVLRFGPSAAIPLDDQITCWSRPGDDW